MHRARLIGLFAIIAAGLSACDGLDRGLTGHARPAAEVGSVRLTAEALATLMADSEMPDSVITGHWAGELALLWTDYVRLASVYRSPDTTSALDYSPILEEQKYFAAIAVDRFRDSVVFADIEPTEEELLQYFEDHKPFRRMHLRRILLELPPDADEAQRDRRFTEAEELRARLDAGESFVELAREHSTEPVAARGQLLQYQGHEDFDAAADSVVYRLHVGETSPVVATATSMALYRVEEVIEPEFESVRDMTLNLQLQERKDSAATAVIDTLVGNARRAVADGAIEVARKLASGSAGERMPGGRELVRYRDGAVTVDEVRRLFALRKDIQRMFIDGDDEDREDYLLQLARDEILTRAAYRAGAEPSEHEKNVLRDVLAGQLAHIGEQFRLSHQLVISPLYDEELESLGFLRRVLLAREALPWVGEFRMVLDPAYPARVDPRGSETAARLAKRIRDERARQAGSPATGHGNAATDAATQRIG